MSILVWISLLILLSYIAYGIYCSGGIPHSISATYYSIKHKWAFSASLISASILALVPWLEYSDKFQFCAFIGVGSLMFVGASPAFKDSFINQVHMGAAITMFIATTVWLIANIGWPILLLICAVIACCDRKNYITWLELGLLFELYLTLIR